MNEPLPEAATAFIDTFCAWVKSLPLSDAKEVINWMQQIRAAHTTETTNGPAN